MATLSAVRGDITTYTGDAIVNAANSSLLGGGGVDGAIHRAGGAAILDECRAIVARQGGCRTSEAVITTAGDMPAHHVIHTVGPVWGSGSASQTDELLASAYRSSLRLAAEHGIASIAFPNISTGVYGYPKDRAAPIAIEAVRSEAARHRGLAEVVFVCHDAENFAIYERLLLSDQ